MPTERLMREVEWPRPDWLSAITGAFIFVALVAAGVLVSMVWPAVSIPAPPAAEQIGRWQMQAVYTLTQYNIYVLDTASSATYVLRDGRWLRLPALPERSE